MFQHNAKACENVANCIGAFKLTGLAQDDIVMQVKVREKKRFLMSSIHGSHSQVMCRKWTFHIMATSIDPSLPKPCLEPRPNFRRHSPLPNRVSQLGMVGGTGEGRGGQVSTNLTADLTLSPPLHPNRFSCTFVQINSAVSCSFLVQAFSVGCRSLGRHGCRPQVCISVSSRV